MLVTIDPERPETVVAGKTIDDAADSVAEPGAGAACSCSASGR